MSRKHSELRAQAAVIVSVDTWPDNSWGCARVCVVTGIAILGRLNRTTNRATHLTPGWGRDSTSLTDALTAGKGAEFQRLAFEVLSAMERFISKQWINALVSHLVCSTLITAFLCCPPTGRPHCSSLHIEYNRLLTFFCMLWPQFKNCIEQQNAESRRKEVESTKRYPKVFIYSIPYLNPF